MNEQETLNFWSEANELLDKCCHECDQTWQKRKRILDTKLLVIFILKMVLSKNKQGYASNLSQFWESCAEKGIMLPKINPVAPSSLCEARQKLPETIFKTLNQELVDLWHKHRTTPTWNGHRVFAIDGSKINAPRGLLNYNYKTAKNTSRHYPYGMMSCIYNVQEQIIYDFDFVSHGDERGCAIEHLKKLRSEDLVLFDRGYFSYLMLYRVAELHLNAVFRMQNGRINGKVDSFWSSDRKDELIEYYPSEAVKSDLRKRGHKLSFKPITVRLVKGKLNDEIYVYATTLIDVSKYPVACFSDLYHGRWCIEELYKVSKNFIDIEDFHAQTERGVKHELYGHFLLINVARIFELDAKGMSPVDKDEGPQEQKMSDPVLTLSAKKPFKINFKNCLAVVGRNLEKLFLAPTQLIRTWLYKTMQSVSKIRQRMRPWRSYSRVSLKPRSRWVWAARA